MSVDKMKLARREAHIAIWGNALLFAYKFYVGLITGSVAIMADAWHTLSDSLSSLVILVGVRISGRPADAEHPYGHGRAELIVALIVGVMLEAVALEFFVKGLDKLLERQAAEYGIAAMTAMIVTIIVKEGMAQYALFLARKTGMLVLGADAKHHRSDALSSILVLVGVFAGSRWWWVDGGLAMLVAVFIAIAGIQVLREASDQLLGREASPELLEDIWKLAVETLGRQVGIHHVHLHTYGAHRELTCHIRMDGEMTLEAAHSAAQLLEQRLEDKFGFHSTIHVEPRPAEKENNSGER